MRAKFKNSLFGYSKKQVDGFVNGLNTEELESRLKQLVDENVKLSVELKVAKSGYADAAELLGETRMRVRELEEQLASERYRNKQTENKFNRILEEMKQDYTLQIEDLQAELKRLKEQYEDRDIETEYQPRNIEKIKQDVFEKPHMIQRKPLTASAAKPIQQRSEQSTPAADDYWAETPAIEQTGKSGEILDDVISSLVELQLDVDDDFEQQIRRQEQDYSLEARAQQIQQYTTEQDDSNVSQHQYTAEQADQANQQQYVEQPQVYGDDVFKQPNPLQAKLHRAHDDYNAATKKAEREYRDSVYEANGDDFEDIIYTPPAGMEHLLDNEPKGGARGVMNRIYKLRSAMNTPSTQEQFSSRIPHQDLDSTDTHLDKPEIYQHLYQQIEQPQQYTQNAAQPFDDIHYEQPTYASEPSVSTYEQPTYEQTVFERPPFGQQTQSQHDAFAQPDYNAYSQPAYEQPDYSQSTYEAAKKNYDRLAYEQPYSRTERAAQHVAPTFPPRSRNIQHRTATDATYSQPRQEYQDMQQSEYSYNKQGTRPAPQAVSPRNIRK